jgi:hypothetical protein
MGERLSFPPRRAGTLLRGAFGRILKNRYPDAYSEIFDPSANGPSGIADAPRPFVLRVSHLEGQEYQPGTISELRLNLFEGKGTFLPIFDDIFRQMGREGLGPERARCDWAGSVVERRELTLAPPSEPVHRVEVTFRTPTELKVESKSVTRPDFAALFRRLSSRISTLRMLYGEGPIDADFRGMSSRAESVELTNCRIRQSFAERLSRRTGQVHPIGGFAGVAEYSGELSEFLPFLLIGQHTGVGRQTVWGKGEIAVEVLG